jgi:hypothetical protein
LAHDSGVKANCFAFAGDVNQDDAQFSTQTSAVIQSYPNLDKPEILSAD